MTAATFMLDTNIISDMIKNPNGRAAHRARTHQDQLCTSIIVAAELRYGCAKKSSAKLTHKIEAILEEIGIIALDEPVDQIYGLLRTELERSGQPIGANDLVIAAQASSLNLTLVTANTREFERIRGLRLENWLLDEPTSS